VRASSRQHEKVQEFLDQVLLGARRQVLIEATVAEVQLNNQYQRGIDWQRLRGGATTVGRPAFGTGTSGVEFGQSSVGTPAAVSTTAFVLGGAVNSLNFNFALSLLESFGDVKVLSSPKLSVLNNQTALLRVTRDIIYFQVTPSNVTVSGSGGGTLTVPPSFTTTPLVAAEGFMMSVLPQINDADTIVLNVRPTIRRRVGNATDPNPALTTPNLIPIFETREFDSVLRLQSGQVAVLGGLMQDQRSRTEDTIPGINAIPGVGELLEQKTESNTKTELVIFLRATVIREPSIDGDFRALRDSLPGEDFLSRPNPARVAPPVGPGESTR
jgi:general secretion pathway protein D